MATTHTLQEFFIGDDWQINGTLYESDGARMQLVPEVSIEWGLLNENNTISVQTSDVNIAVVSAEAGTLTIKVPHAITALLAPGQYSDALRVTFADTKRATMWTGPIKLKASPFGI